MATWYVNSAAAGTGAGTSWTNACTTLAAAITLSAAGDDFNVLSTHAESTASALTLTFKGTAAAPSRVFSCGATHSPAQDSDLQAGASVTTTGASALAIGGHVYVYGVIFNVGTGTSAASTTLTSGSGDQTFEACAFNHLVTTATCVLMIGTATTVVSQRVTLINTPVNFSGGAASSITNSAANLRWINTASAVGGATSLNSLVTGTSRPCLNQFVGLDLTGVAAGKNLVGALSASMVCQFVDCRLTAGVLVATPTVIGARVDLINCDSGATGYKQASYQYQGTLTASASTYNGASDGVTPIAWQVVTTANANRQSPFECFEIVRWVAAGTFAASLINITSSAAGLTSADVWADVEYLGSSGYPLASKVSSGPATQLTAGASLAAGAGWTGSAGHDYQLTIPSFTAAIAGYVRATVKVAKASATVYVDPALIVA